MTSTEAFNSHLDQTNKMDIETENQPLLQERTSRVRIEGIEPRFSQPPNSGDGALLRWARSFDSHKAYLYTIVFGLHLVIHFAAYMCEMPEIALFERIICRQYYNYPKVVDESLCKIPQVQDKLAHIRGLKSGLESIPGIASFVCNLLRNKLTFESV